MRFLWWSHTRGGFTFGVEAVDAKAASEIVRRLDPNVLQWSGQIIEFEGELYRKSIEAGMNELTGKFKPTHCPPFLGTVLTSKYDAVPTPAEDPSPAVVGVPADARPADDEARPVPSVDGGVGCGVGDLPVLQTPGREITHGAAERHTPIVVRADALPARADADGARVLAERPAVDLPDLRRVQPAGGVPDLLPVQSIKPVTRDPTPVQTSSREVVPFWKLV